MLREILNVELMIRKAQVYFHWYMSLRVVSFVSGHVIGGSIICASFQRIFTGNAILNVVRFFCRLMIASQPAVLPSMQKLCFINKQYGKFSMLIYNVITLES